MRKENITIVIILLLGLVLRIVNLNQSLWLDEAAQVIESSRPFLSQFDIHADFHPPLYHLILHFWMYWGKSEAWIRLPSVLFGLLSIFILFQLGKSIKKEKEGLLAAAFLALSPYHLWYSQEARPYMLFVFVSLLSTYFLIYKRWLYYSLTILFSLYSLYFAPFLIVSHLFYIYLFQKKDLMIFVKTQVLTGVFFLPWVPSLFTQLKVGTQGLFTGWTNVVSIMPIRVPFTTFAKFIFGHGKIEDNIVYIGVLFPILLIFLLSILKTYREKSGQTLILLFFTPFISAISISFFIPIIAPQRLIFLLPIFYLIIALGIFRLSNNWQKWAVFMVILVSLLGIVQYYTNPYTQREKWKEATFFVEEREDEKVIALFVFPEPFAPYLWYKKDKIEAVGIAPKFILQDEDLINLGSILTNKKKIYLFQYLTGLTDPKEKTREFLIKEDYKESSIKDFPGVGFVYVYER